MEEGKMEGTKNSRIKASLFRNKKKPRHTEDEGQEVKRIKKLIESNNMPEPETIKKFQNLPLSKKTLMGLKEAGYTKPTEIQRESIGLALRGLDILGAAQTGSGKSLAFIIPVLEKLFLNLWTQMDGLGALIITPTRELAYQIFETLRKVGKRHDFSAALIIGGKDLKFERKRLDQMNIVICTPGRLLQHMDENPNFDCSNLQIVVLDEADRCLDMGFERDMNAIIENLPPTRQTLLFSATQTKSVKDLARLSLKTPVYVSVHENSTYSTPDTLQQSYVVCPLDTKLDMLWSFVKHHKHSKILVFLSSCKQVRYIHMLFCRMRPGISVLALYGSLHQLKRMSVYDEYCKKQAVVMFATDIAARGLDFPGVDWVVQLDCPEDATTYIHRAGRTARYNKGGEALLVLLPTEEEAMVEELTQKKIPIQKIEVNQNKQVSVRRKFESLLARDINLKECAQRAFKSYLKSVFLMKNKKVFDVNQVDLESFARSLGLAVAPRVRFLQKKAQKSDEDLDIKLQANSDSDVSVDEEEEKKEQRKLSKTVKSTVPAKPGALKSYDFSLPDDEDSDNAEDLFKSQKPAVIEGDVILDEPGFNTGEGSKSKKPKSKAALAKKLLKKNIQTNKKFVFDEEGSAVPDIRKERQSEMARDYDREDVSGIDIEKAKQILQEEDHYDKQIFRERIRAKHREERLKKRMVRKGLTKDQEEEAREDREEEEVGVTLGNDDEESGSEPDLSWLPDPDKIYGPARDSDVSGGDSDFSDDEDDEFGHSRKRQIEVVNSDSESELDESFVLPDKISSEDNDNLQRKTKKAGVKKRKLVDNSLDKGMMEELALKLLSK